MDEIISTPPVARTQATLADIRQRLEEEIAAVAARVKILKRVTKPKKTPEQIAASIEKRRARQRAYCARNREVIKERSRNYNAKNRQRINERHRRYYQLHRAQVLESLRKNYVKRAEELKVKRLADRLDKLKRQYEELQHVSGAKTDSTIANAAT